MEATATKESPWGEAADGEQAGKDIGVEGSGAT